MMDESAFTETGPGDVYSSSRSLPKPQLSSQYPCASSCLDREGPVAKATHTLRVILSGPVKAEGGK